MHSEYNKNCNLPSLQLKKSKQTSKGYLFGMGREEKVQMFTVIKSTETKTWANRSPWLKLSGNYTPQQKPGKCLVTQRWHIVSVSENNVWARKWYSLFIPTELFFFALFQTQRFIYRTASFWQILSPSGPWLALNTKKHWKKMIERSQSMYLLICPTYSLSTSPHSICCLPRQTVAALPSSL